LNQKLRSLLPTPKKERNCADGFVIGVLQKMLQLDPANRISAIAAIDHPYFNSLDKF
jgi:serine/threonine protein kinase